MSVDASSTVPIYQQIAAYIRRAVAAGVYRPGETIPSTRSLALKLTVNPNTIQRAFETLEREGLIVARKGLGMFVTKNGAASAQRRSEAAVYEAFGGGIRAGRDASLPEKRIRGTFERAWKDVHSQTRHKT